MKKALLFCALFCFTVVLHAQTSVVVADSTFYSDSYGEPLQFRSSNAYHYNENCLDTLIYSTYRNTNDSTLREAETYFEYNADNSVHSYIYRIRDTAQNGFVNSDRHTYNYISGPLYYQEAYDRWENGNWQKYSLSTNRYLTAAKPLSLLRQLWDSAKQAYVNTNRQINTYNADSLPADISTQTWDTTRSVWITTFRFIALYNGSGLKTSDTLQYINKPGDSVTTRSYQDYYYSAGRLDSSFQTNLDFSSSTKRYYAYYPQSDKVRQMTTYFFFGGTPSNVLRDTYAYDTSSNVIRDSDYVESAPATGTGNYNFTPQSLYVRESYFNAEQQRVKYIYKGFLYSNGQIADSSLYVVDSVYAPCSSALPLTLLRFSAVQKSSDAIVQWQTANETGISYFTVERSVDGIHFSAIGKVAALHKASGSDYLFTDKNIAMFGTNKVWYRLAEYSMDSNVVYSKTVLLPITNKLSLSVFPNPVSNAVNLYSPSPLFGAEITISDAGGKLLYSIHKNLAAGNNKISEASSLSKGVYFLSVHTSSCVQTIKLIKE